MCDAVGEHGGDDVGIVDLLASNFRARKQIKQLLCHLWAVLNYPELSFKLADVWDEQSHRHQSNWALWAGKCCQVLSHYLPANIKHRTCVVKFFESLLRQVAKR